MHGDVSFVGTIWNPATTVIRDLEHTSITNNGSTECCLGDPAKINSALVPLVPQHSLFPIRFSAFSGLEKYKQL